MTDTPPNTKDTAPAGKVETEREKRNRKARERRAAAKSAKSDARDVVEQAAPATGAAGRPKGSGTKQSKRAQNVAGIVAGIGVVVERGFDPYDGRVIKDGAGDLGAAVADLAETSPRIAKLIDAGIETSAWVALASAVSAIVIPIAAHHGLFDRRRLPVDVDDQGDAADAYAAAPDAYAEAATVTAQDGVPTFQARH